MMNNWFDNPIDLSPYSPELLEVFARQGYDDDDRFKWLLPDVALAFVDPLFLGISGVLLVDWWSKARPTEKMLNKVLVYWTSVMILAFSLTRQGYMLWWFALGFGQYRYRLYSAWVKIILLLSKAVRAPIMAFYLHRAYLLAGKSKILVILITPFIAFLLAMVIAQFVLIGDFMPYPRSLIICHRVMSICELVGDVTITTTIGYNLWKMKTGWRSTDRLIKQLILSTVETQAPPTLLSIAALILWFVTPNTPYLYLPSIAPKFAYVCMLSTLLARLPTREGTRNKNESLPFRSALLNTSDAVGLCDASAGGARYEDID